MTGLAVGNDIVDLGDARLVGKLDDERFVRRILTAAEHEDVSCAVDPHLALWTRWAAKEAAYKVVSKLRGAPPVFVHRDYELRDDHAEHEGVAHPIRVVESERVLHVIASAGISLDRVVAEAHPLEGAGTPWSASVEALRSRMTEREAEAVHSHRSAAVRIGARITLARVLDVEERRIEIVCRPGVIGRRPPFVLLDGAPAPADVSLSHHGAWIGWAVVAT